MPFRDTLGKKLRKPGVFRAYLAEDYDGIGQYMLVSLTRASTSGVFKARVAAGDFNVNSQVSFPHGTPVVVFVYHGEIEIMSLGYKVTPVTGG